MSVYQCYDCNKVLCKDCSRKHDNEKKYKGHSMQLISDSFILQCQYGLEMLIYEIECLSNGLVVVVGSNAQSLEMQLMTMNVSGERRHVIQLETITYKITEVDKNTAAVLLTNRALAIVDIQQNHVKYIRNIPISYSSEQLIYIENEFYIDDAFGIVVIDMSGSVKRRIPLSFTPCDMCYDVGSQHIYYSVREPSQLLCIDRYGKNIFTFTDPSMTSKRCLTIDKEGNVLVLCRKEDDNSRYVIKVDSNGEKSEVVISNTNTSSYQARICYDHLTNSVVIGLRYTVNIYKKKV